MVDAGGVLNNKIGKMVKRYRSAKSGHYVSEEYAKKHKSTTVAETDKKAKKK